MLNKDYIPITHHSPELKTVGAYINPNVGFSIARQFIDKEAEFLDYAGDTGITNRERVLEEYTPQETVDNEGKDDKDLLLKVLTKLLIPKDQLSREAYAIIGQNQLVEQTTYNAFIAAQLQNLMSDANYVRTEVFETKTLGVNKEISPRITVWAWCRSLSHKSTEADELPGSFFDLSPFVQSINTNVGKNGGNFQLTLTPIIAQKDDQKGWVIKERSVSSYGSQHVADSALHRVNADAELERNTFFFHNVIGPNDMIFIRFETLKSEVLTREEDKKKFFISRRDIPGRIYDMIGLIDENQLATSAPGNDVSIQINGRDLMKVLIEDGNYFYPLFFAQNIFENPQEDKRLLNRLSTSGAYKTLFTQTYRSISDSLQFIINQLANLGVVPDDLFLAYGDRRTKVYREVDLTNRFAKEKSATTTDIKNRIVQVRFLDEISTAKTLEESDVGLINALFDEVKSFITQATTLNKITFSPENNTLMTGWDPFIYQGESLLYNQYPTSFIGRLFNFTSTNPLIKAKFTSSDLTIANQPPSFTVLDPIFILMEDLVDLEKSGSNYKQEPTLVEASGVWQIIKIAVDENVASRRMQDSSISFPDGSILNQFNKICQEPFVEFFGDTYGDFYHLIARQPPFTGKAIREYIARKPEFVDDPLEPETFQTLADAQAVESARQTKAEFMIDVEDKDVFSDNLTFADDQAYSFYELTPQSMFLGKKERALDTIPVVYFPAYANVFGARRMSEVTNYIPYEGLGGFEDSNNRRYFLEQAVQDLKFMIDTTMYLPFTRKGTIEINGDRRIKRGTFIRYKPTKEIFYVENVQQTYTVSARDINRTTTLRVSRGMVERFTELQTMDVAGVDTEVSYFNIINTEVIKDFIIAKLNADEDKAAELGVEVKKNFAVNVPVFNFFLKRRQYELGDI